MSDAPPLPLMRLGGDPAPAAPSLPSGDDLFGPDKGLPSGDDLFGAPSTDVPNPDVPYGPGNPHIIAAGDRVLGAFGQGLREGWGTGTKFDPATEETLKKLGLHQEVTDGSAEIARGFNGAVLRPGATGLVFDALARGGQETLEQFIRGGRTLFMGANALATGVIHGTTQLATEIGGPGFGRGIGGLLEAEMARQGGEFGAHAGVSPGEIARETAPEPMPPVSFLDRDRAANQAAAIERRDAYDELYTAHANNVIGRGGEDVYFGLKEPMPIDPQFSEPPPIAEIEPPPVRDIHSVAREIAPEVFSEYDQLQQQREVLREQIAQGEQEGLRIGIMNPLRAEERAADARLQDLAPEVASAYRSAEMALPREPAEPTETPAAAPVAAPGGLEGLPLGDVQPRATQPAEGAPVAAAEPAAPRAPINIAEDVAAKLQAAGRPADEAAASGAIVDAYWTTRAAALGEDASDLYRRMGPDIRPGGVGGREGQAAGKARLANGNAVITLFDKADPSTFLHETGHEWVERLMADGRDPNALEGFITDAGTVREWLGAEGNGPLTTRQHERFARGFEQYMREGRAPSKELAGVFAQFKAWLMQIYETIKSLGKPINDDIRGVFDRFLAKEPVPRETVIAPEREFINRGQASPYDRVPPEPERLNTMLIRAGGLKDQGGELTAMLGGASGRPGLINNQPEIVRGGKTIYRGGLNHDDAARHAGEVGYFPEKGGERPTINELLDKIREDHTGNPQYAAQDAEAAIAHHEAIARNSEIDRLADELGLDPKGLTREQFFDRVAEKMSEREIADEISNAAAHVDDFVDDAQRWIDEYAEHSEPRTPEDLEREWDEAKAAESAKPRATGAGEPGRTGRPEAAGEDGAGPGGNGAQPTGRTLPKTDAPASPVDQFASPAAELVDKAGNIRLDNLDTPESINAVIRDMATNNDDFINARRGVVHDADVISMADAIGANAADLNIEKLRAMSLDDPYPFAARVWAAREMLRQQGARLRDAMQKAAEGSDADVLAFAQEGIRMNLIQETLSAVTAEWGRAGRAFRDMSGETAAAEDLGKFAQDMTGRTLFQIKAMAQKGRKLETPAQMAKFMRDASKRTFNDMLSEFWMNSVLSGPQTHIANIIGNTMTVISSIIETGVAGGIGAAREAMGGAPGVALSEAKGRAFGLVQGTVDGLKIAGNTFWYEGFQHAGQTVEARNFRAIPSVNVGGINVGGATIRIPTRALAAEDELFKAIAYRQEINAQAERMATNEGLSGQEKATRVSSLAMDPTEAMMQAAVANSTYQTFTNTLGQMGRAVQAVSNANIFAKLLLPFVRTPVNILKYAMARTPAALASAEVRANLMGKNGPAMIDTQASRILVGTAIGTTIFMLADKSFDLIDGAGPVDNDEKAAWLLAGHVPYSVRVGDFRYGLRRLDPWAFLFSVAADAAQLKNDWKDKELTALAGQFTLSIGKSFIEGTGMRGLSDIVGAVTDPKQKGERWAQNFIAGFYPFGGMAAQAARATDPYAREARTLVGTLKAKTPILSQTLEPRIDIFGQKMPGRDALGPDMLSVIPQRQINDDPVLKAFRDLDFFPSQVKREILGVKLTDAEHTEYAIAAGKLVKMQLDMLVGTLAMEAIPKGERYDLLKSTVEGAHQQAATMMQMQHPHLVFDALKNQQLHITTGAHSAKLQQAGAAAH